jgi:hypothetical protein
MSLKVLNFLITYRSLSVEALRNHGPALAVSYNGLLTQPVIIV